MAVCKYCGEEIFFGYTASGQVMPLNDGLMPYKAGGKDRIYLQKERRVVACMLIRNPEKIRPDGWGFVPHFGTCKGYKKGRKNDKDGKRADKDDRSQRSADGGPLLRDQRSVEASGDRVRRGGGSEMGAGHRRPGSGRWADASVEGARRSVVNWARTEEEYGMTASEMAAYLKSREIAGYTEEQIEAELATMRKIERGL